MKVSNKMRQAIYVAVHEAVMQARIKLARVYELPAAQDAVVAEITTNAWAGIRVAMSLPDTQPKKQTAPTKKGP